MVDLYYLYYSTIFPKALQLKQVFSVFLCFILNSDLGIKSIAIAADISQPDDVQRMLSTILAKWGTVHIACNNAGINMNSPSEETSLEEWDKTFNVNLRGLFLCCQVSIGSFLQYISSFLCFEKQYWHCQAFAKS